MVATTALTPGYSSSAEALPTVSVEEDALPVEDTSEGEDVDSSQDAQGDAEIAPEEEDVTAPEVENVPGMETPEEQNTELIPEGDAARSSAGEPAELAEGASAAELAATSAQASCVVNGARVSGCARIGSFNLGHSDYFPGFRMCTEDRISEGYCTQKNLYYRTRVDNKSTNPYEFGNVSKQLWDRCMQQFPKAVQNCIKKGSWTVRKAHVKAVISDANVDVVNLQEITDDPVWSSWTSTGQVKESTYRKEVAALMKSLGFTKAELSSADREKICPGYSKLAADQKKRYGEKAEIYYQASQYKLVTNSQPSGTFVSVEGTLMKGSAM
ncbi:hypothetical protein G7066_13390 [Leucobacter coleopterorum]|uniref:Endonuclease/Exonuclease/phosphatase family protein n=1 Tax=Leucobacter coleopterorum TaxID=2714933 RepID=A0ABX6JYE9_9MICO|nr:hypothetical protein [Leucobacter coleopterorum]QIM19316.1 hypothetical protein G7066_13390 [Leucobacter coleopterorum]